MSRHSLNGEDWAQSRCDTTLSRARQDDVLGSPLWITQGQSAQVPVRALLDVPPIMRSMGAESAAQQRSTPKRRKFRISPPPGIRRRSRPDRHAPGSNSQRMAASRSENRP